MKANLGVQRILLTQLEDSVDKQKARDRADAILAAWNRRDYDDIASHLTQDVVLVDHTRGRTSTGPGGYVDRFRRLLDAFPDMRGESVSVLAEGNLLVQETLWRGRHTAPLILAGYDHVAPTKELMTMHLVTYMELDDDGHAKVLRTYGLPSEVPIAAQPVGVG
jgi:ketosteroid isomerase-like protein